MTLHPGDCEGDPCVWCDQVARKLAEIRARTLDGPRVCCGDDVAAKFAEAEAEEHEAC
jgi:hypothetical protein